MIRNWEEKKKKKDRCLFIYHAIIALRSITCMVSAALDKQNKQKGLLPWLRAKQEAMC